MGSLTDNDIRSHCVVNAWMQVEGGVLLIADKGSSSDVSLEILDAPPATRPEMQMAGRIIAAPGGYYAGYGHQVRRRRSRRRRASGEQRCGIVGEDHRRLAAEGRRANGELRRGSRCGPQ